MTLFLVKLKKINNSIKKQVMEGNRKFSKEKMHMVRKYLSKNSITLAMRKLQIKTILNLYITPVSMAIINNTNNTNADIGGREILYIHYLLECKLGKSL